MQVGNESVPSDLLESPGTSEESSADEQSSVESSEDISVAAPEETSEELSESATVPEDSSETQVEYITETGSDVTYISTYTKDDLAGIQTRLEVIICLLFVLVIYIVVKICRSILEILGF